MYVDGVSFQIYVDQLWMESIEVMLFCMTMNFKVSSDWSKPDREAVNWYRVCVRSVDCTRVLTLQKQATGPTNRATQRLCMKSCFLCFKVFLLEHALTLQALTQAGSNALHCHQDISLALSLLQPWDPEPGTKTKGTEDVAWGSRVWTDGVVGWDEAFPYLVLCFHMRSYVQYLHFAILALLFARTPKAARRVVLTMLHRTLLPYKVSDPS